MSEQSAAKGVKETVKAGITCPKCGKQSEFDMWISINTQLHPEMKQAVRDRSAFVFTCPECGAETPVDYGFLYQDPEDMIMIQYVTDDAQAQKVHDMLTADGNERVRNIRNAGYLIRLVRSAAEMADKLAVFDAQMDDRIVEVYKLSALSALRRDHPDLDPSQCEFVFYTEESGEHMLQIMNGGEPFGAIKVNMDAYRSMENDFIGILADMQYEDPVVDRKMALELIKILGEQ